MFQISRIQQTQSQVVTENGDCSYTQAICLHSTTLQAQPKPIRSYCVLLLSKFRKSSGHIKPGHSRKTGTVVMPKRTVCILQPRKHSLKPPAHSTFSSTFKQQFARTHQVRIVEHASCRWRGSARLAWRWSAGSAAGQSHCCGSTCGVPSGYAGSSEEPVDQRHSFVYNNTFCLHWCKTT